MKLVTTGFLGHLYERYDFHYWMVYNCYLYITLNLIVDAYKSKANSNCYVNLYSHTFEMKRGCSHTQKRQNDEKPQNPHTKTKTPRSFSFPMKAFEYFTILFSNLTCYKLQLKMPYFSGYWKLTSNLESEWLWFIEDLM